MDRHLHREIGPSGLRIVRIDVHTRGRLTSSYSVGHLWVQNGNQCNSLMCLLSPAVFAGTCILLTETRASENAKVWLKLATSKRVVELAPQRIRDFVLGSDFTYEDMRFWLPLDASKSCEKRLELVELSASTSREKSVVRFHESGCILERKWVLPGAITAWKTLSSQEFVETDGVIQPTEIVVSREETGYFSQMRLLRCRINFPASTLWFRSAFIASSEEVSWLRDRLAREMAAGK